VKRPKQRRKDKKHRETKKESTDFKECRTL
jgi:hypothetical protein